VKVDTYEVLYGYAKKLYKGNKTLFSYVNIFEPADLLHEFIVSSKYDSELPLSLMIGDLKQYCYRVARNAKRRKEAGTVITYSNNKYLDNFGENYRDDDIIDSYIYSKSALSEEVQISLYDYQYKDIRGNINYDLMLEDIQKVMGMRDRLYRAKNTCNNREYWVGNVWALPLEQYFKGRFYKKAEVEEDDGVGRLLSDDEVEK
jgi:hypothetical protein